MAFVALESVPALLLVLYVAFGPSAQAAKPGSMEAVLQILEKQPVVDGHNDLPMTLRDLFPDGINNANIYDGLDKDQSQTSLKRMIEGKVGGQVSALVFPKFWSVFAPCSSQGKDAVKRFLEQADLVKRLVRKYPQYLSLVTNSKVLTPMKVQLHVTTFSCRSYEELEEVISSRKTIGSMLGMESGHAIDSSLDVLRMFHDVGVRYMTLTHSCNTPWATFADAPEDKGLSDWGRIVVKEMNRLGMLVDLSHVSDKTMSDALDVATAPVIFSHSSARGVYNHSRNVPDDILLKVKQNGGIVMVDFVSCYLAPSCKSTVDDVVEHITYIKEKIGVDHVGLGSDFNGVSLVPEGLEDVSKYPNIFVRLYDMGWTEEELGKLASGNLVRVWREADFVRDQLVQIPPFEDRIPENEYTAFHES